MKSNKKIAVVVQRAGKDILGGAEEYAMFISKILSSRYRIDILTTTTKDSMTWNNIFPPGDEKISKNLTIKRFSVDQPRNTLFWNLNGIIQKNTTLEQYTNETIKEQNNLQSYISSLPLGISEEWVKLQGPYSSDLLNFLKRNNDEYYKIIFNVYLYATTYYGIDQVINHRNILYLPTFHDEPAVYLPIFQKYLALNHVFHTNAEFLLAKKIYNCSITNHAILGHGMIDKYSSVNLENKQDKYIIYAGRLEKGKGVSDLLTMFNNYYSKHKNIKLILIGKGELENIKQDGVEYKGFVSESQKYQLIKNALAFVHPSAFESLSIVLIESFMMGTPAIVNRRSTILKEHIDRSQAGMSYLNEVDFENSLNILSNNTNVRNKMKINARKYFKDNYDIEKFKKRLFDLLEKKT